MARKILPISMLRAMRMNKYGKLLIEFKREVRRFKRIDSYYETWCLFEKLDYVYRNLNVFYKGLPETQKKKVKRMYTCVRLARKMFFEFRHEFIGNTWKFRTMLNDTVGYLNQITEKATNNRVVMNMLIKSVI